MLDLVEDDIDQTTLRMVDFSDIAVGDKFTTDRWVWEKVDCEYARALDEMMGRSKDMVGAVFYFQPWSKVQLIEHG